jgi:hypothetical protein
LKGKLAWLATFYEGFDGSMYRNMLAADRVELMCRRALEMASFLDVLEQNSGLRPCTSRRDLARACEKTSFMIIIIHLGGSS